MTGARSPNDTAVIGGGGGAGSPEDIAGVLVDNWYAWRRADGSRFGEEVSLSGGLKKEIATAIRDARARALDEAAKVAEDLPPNVGSRGNWSIPSGMEIASAIRSLKAQPIEGIEEGRRALKEPQNG